MNWHTETRKISELKNWKNNPRTISEESYKELKESIGSLGNFEPLVINVDGTVLAGNQRLRVAKEKGDKEVEVSVPERELTEEEVKKIGIISNRHSGEWDMDKLANEFEDILEELGFDDLLPEVELEVEEDDYEEPEDLETTVVLGDVYQLGEHRLMCGDSTKIEDVEKLMNGQKADMVFTDPPYGISLETDLSSIRTELRGWKGQGGRYKPVIGDDKPFDASFFIEYFGDIEQFWWGANYYSYSLPEYINCSWLVWDKRENESGGKVDGGVGSEFELCWSKKKHQQQIIRKLWSGLYGTETQDVRSRIHPTQKPLEVSAWVLERYSEEGNIVVDIFGGSGSTLIACEQTNRKCYMMEIDPYYCQVIIDRWEKFTNKKAVKLN